MDTSDRGLLRSIICGCPGWRVINLLDDDIDFRTMTWRLPGCILRTDVIYDRCPDDGMWRLFSVGLTMDDRWVIDYAFGEGPVRVLMSEYRVADGEMVRPLAGLHEIPPYQSLLLQTLDPYLLNLALVSRALPIPCSTPRPVAAATARRRPGRPPLAPRR